MWKTFATSQSPPQSAYYTYFIHFLYKKSVDTFTHSLNSGYQMHWITMVHLEQSTRLVLVQKWVHFCLLRYYNCMEHTIHHFLHMLSCLLKKYWCGLWKYLAQRTYSTCKQRKFNSYFVNIIRISRMENLGISQLW